MAVEARLGEAGQGVARQGGRGRAGRGLAWQGGRGGAWRGGAGQGRAGLGWAVEARRGTVWPRWIQRLPEGAFLGTSDDVPGLTVECDTQRETTIAAMDVAVDLLEMEVGQSLDSRPDFD
jgi:hypothetical protein